MDGHEGSVDLSWQHTHDLEESVFIRRVGFDTTTFQTLTAAAASMDMLSLSLSLSYDEYPPAWKHRKV